MLDETHLIKFILRHMTSKDRAVELVRSIGAKCSNSLSYEKLSELPFKQGNQPYDLTDITNYFRRMWIPSPSNFHIANLIGGSLQGHDWHGAMPSMLHLSMQNKVRSCIDGNIKLSELLEIGTDIMRHEYFMVATHDLLETRIIEAFPDVIPPIGRKSVADFVFNGIPYDLKNTNYFGGWTKASAKLNPGKVAIELLEGADVQRLRKQAISSLNGWGLNRFFVMVEDQERWIGDPLGILDELEHEARNLNDPHIISIGDLRIIVQLIFI